MKTARTPRRWLQIFHPRRWRQFLAVLRFEQRGRTQWKPATGEAGFKQREYASYDQYLQHQQSKLQYLDLTEYDRNYRQQLRERLAGWTDLIRGANVLCLGARQGTEVKAFIDLGCKAIGIDLNPGGSNPLVIKGDFHNLPFDTASKDIVFTNSLDHVFDIQKVIAQVTRVLKPGGWLVIELICGEEEATAPDHYASFWWKKTDDVVALLEKHGFKAGRRLAFDQPWPGEQICLQFAPPSVNR
jgi:SAM-dependent methyltransferase